MSSLINRAPVVNPTVELRVIPAPTSPAAPARARPQPRPRVRIADGDARLPAESAAAIAERFRLAGFIPGAPLHLTPETIQDVEVLVKCMRCPGCGCRSLRMRPFHNLEGRFRVLADCRLCHSGEEC